MTRTLRIVRWTTLGLIVVLTTGIAVLELRPSKFPAVENGSIGSVGVPNGMSVGGPFHLIDDQGHAVTDADYRGRWMLVFFGYSNCPDECPLKLHKMATALANLEPLADRIAPLFITVDPARDTPGRLTSYLANFDPRIVGLTGNDTQIAAVAEAYRVYYSPAEHEKSGIDLVSHSTVVYVMNPDGKFDSVLPSDADTNKIVAFLRAKLAT